jgi:hypothetical protein
MNNGEQTSPKNAVEKSRTYEKMKDWLQGFNWIDRSEFTQLKNDLEQATDFGWWWSSKMQDRSNNANRL